MGRYLSRYSGGTQLWYRVVAVVYKGKQITKGLYQTVKYLCKNPRVQINSSGVTTIKHNPLYRNIIHC